MRRREEEQVVGRGRRLMQRAEDIAGADFGAFAQARARQIVADGRQGVALSLDEEGMGGAATQRFDADAAGAREEIQEATLAQLGGENAEERFF